MADTKALRGRIKSVDSTLHLTKAMGLVASSKIRRANEAMIKGRQYCSAFRAVMAKLLKSKECEKSIYMRSSGDNPRTRIVIIAGDRGLAGGYNANVFRLAAEFPEAEFIPIGKRTCDKFGAAVNSSENYSSSDVSALAHKLCEDFTADEYDRLGIIRTRYVSMLQQIAEVEWLLPFTRDSDGVEPSDGMIFEPDEASILNAAVPEFVAGIIMGSIRESFASEVSARRAAMDAAGRNAEEMIESLRLEYNRARQGAITQEITEIVAGSGE